MVSFTSNATATAPGNTPSPSATTLPNSTSNLTSSWLGNVTTIVFGVIATLLGLLTVWKTHRAWHAWYLYHIQIGNGVNNAPTRDDSANIYQLQQRGTAGTGPNGDPLPPYTLNDVNAETSPLAEVHVFERLSDHSVADADGPGSSPGS